MWGKMIQQRETSCVPWINIVCLIRSDKNQDFEEIKRNDNTIRFLFTDIKLDNHAPEKYIPSESWAVLQCGMRLQRK